MENVINLSMEEVFKDDFPAEYKIAVDSTNEIINSIGDVDFKPLEKHSPALKGNDWPNYLRCSIARLVHVLAGTSRLGIKEGSRVLDFGSYFGNFALAFKNSGYDVDALDSYQKYGATFQGVRKKLADEKVNILDFADVGEMLKNIPPDTYDLILCIGVIEHIPHTPRYLLDSLDRVLKPGGNLILETPNLAYIYNREKFASGLSVMEKIEAQFYTDTVYEGHHREYTVSEMAWMIRELSYEIVSVETFNYSYYANKTIEGVDIPIFWAMVKDPFFRETIMAISKKPKFKKNDLSVNEKSDDSIKTKIIETEKFWKNKDIQNGNIDLYTIATAWRSKYIKMHDELQSEIGLRDANFIKMHDHLQAEVNKRDDMLIKLQEHLQGEVNKRDEIIKQLTNNKS
jgi:2-polyprenyl-3-methyl-5-hydroxy-6-metoxy-1,4-benzoquinol methylase